MPTFAEIAARREQRWDDAPIGQAPVVRVAPKRRWKGPVFAALLGALVAGGGVFAVHAAEGDPAPFAVAATAYEEAVDNAALQAELRAAQTEAEAARVKIKQLETELEALRNAPPPTPPAVASAEPEPKKAKKSRSKRKRVSKRSKSRRSKARTKKRRPRKKTAADKQLDALLDGL